MDYLIKADLLPFRGFKANDPSVKRLSALEVEPKDAGGWFFGHFHLEFQWKHYRCLYNKLYRVPDKSWSSFPY